MCIEWGQPPQKPSRTLVSRERPAARRDQALATTRATSGADSNAWRKGACPGNDPRQPEDDIAAEPALPVSGLLPSRALVQLRRRRVDRPGGQGHLEAGHGRSSG